MKSLLLIAASTLMIAQTGLADDPIVAPGSELVMIQADEIFVPKGFDDNDEVVAVVDGYLPDSCYRVTKNDTFFDQATNKVHIVQFARKYSGLCLPLRVPYWAEVKIGVMPMGNFSLAIEGAAEESLEVAEANSAGPDDFLYAPVESARVESDMTQNRYFAIIQGRFTNTCMAWEEVKLIDSGKTFEVLPIVKMEDRDDCVDAEIPFSWMLDLPDSVAEGRHLLHVRSLNGKAVNHMFSVSDPVLPPIQ